MRAIMIIIPIYDEEPLDYLSDVRHFVNESTVRQADIVGVIDGDNPTYVDVLKDRFDEPDFWYLPFLVERYFDDKTEGDAEEPV